MTEHLPAAAHQPRRISRREMLGRGAAGLAAARFALGIPSASASAATAAQVRPSDSGGRGTATRTGRPLFAYVGCFTGGRARGEGISVYRVEPEPGGWSLVQLLREPTSPSFLVRDPKRPVLYAVLEGAGQVAAFRVDPASGQLAPLNRVTTGGGGPTHLALDPSGRHLLVANYSGGSVSVVPVAADGTLADRTDLVALEGALGPHRTEQATGHPHQCRFDPSGRFVVVPDKGRDRVFVFRLDAATGRLQAAEIPSVATRAGAGPRHIDFHPAAPYAYLVNELDSTVAAYRFDAARGALTAVQILPTTPSSFTGANTGAAIEVSPSGRFVYTSNRGHDSIATFAIDPRDGTLTPRGPVATGGRVPHFLCLDPSGATLYAANQGSDTIIAFGVDPATGALAATGRVVETGTPTAIVFGRG